MKYMRKFFAAVLAACMLCSVSAQIVLASSTSKITSVTIHVKSRVEAGDSISKNDIVEGEPDNGEIGVWVDASKYELDSAKITGGTSSDLKVGKEITIKVVLTTTDDDYIFKSGFSKSSVKVSGSTATVTEVSRSRSRLTVTLRLKGVKGTYSEPDNLEWSDSQIGKATWDAPDSGSGYYEVILKRGGTIIKRVTDLNARKYDFYPYMTKAGTYTFRVRTIPHTSSEKTYGKNSDWAESDEYYLDKEDVSDGTGAVWDYNGGSGSSDSSTPQGPTNVQAGWFVNGGKWNYKFPDGSIKKNGWEKVKDHWYSFDEQGSMRTGWYQSPTGWYYLGADGAMLIGWQNINDQWYYLEDDPNSASYGRMAQGQLLNQNGAVYYVDDKGHRATGWQKVGDHYSYFYPDNGTMARNTMIDTFRVDQNGCWVQ